jgi:hypothetical protein
VEQDIASSLAGFPAGTGNCLSKYSCLRFCAHILSPKRSMKKVRSASTGNRRRTGLQKFAPSCSSMGHEQIKLKRISRDVLAPSDKSVFTYKL